MPGEEIGLKGIYRALGITTAKILARIVKPFNPNIITIASAIICIASIIIFGLYGKKASYDIYMLIFVLGTQLGLILDYADGAYARMVSRTSHYGHILDASLDFVKLTFLLGLSYLVARDRIESLIVFGLALIYGFHCSLKSLSPRLHKQNFSSHKNDSIGRAKTRWGYILRIPFGFNLVHFYLYISLSFLDNCIYTLFILCIVGLISAFSEIRHSLRSHV